MTPLQAAVAVALAFAAFTVVAADVTIVQAARIHTMDPAAPQVEALAFDAGGAILATGSYAELAARWPDATPVDLGRATVVPGLIDAHGHVLGQGQALMTARLNGASSIEEVITRLQDFAKDLPEDVWLIGRGWDQNLWPGKAFPTAADLDEAFPDRPVWLERVDGHAGWANSAALARATRDLGGDWQPDGGEIIRRDGKPTGVLIDTAMLPVDQAVPRPTPALLRTAILRAQDALLAAGLTGVHDAGVSAEVLAVYRGLADEGKLKLRIAAMADGDAQALADLCADGLYTHVSGHLKMRAVKLYMDGALGSRGAALAADYDDAPGQRGLLVTPAERLEAAAGRARDCGVQVATHAIGDRGNRLVLDIYERVLGERRGDDHRWRIEHAQIVALADIPRFHTLGVIASMQPTHATSDMPWAGARVGLKRIVGGYAWRRFRDADIALALGSDFPVEDIRPLLGLYAATTRMDLEGNPAGGWYPNEKLTAYEALRGFTADAARASFDEDRIGTLAAGMRADFTVLDGDPLTVAPSALPGLVVRATWIDGRAAWARTD
jgi:predicted amidohydrolase YtcJ